MAAKPDVKVVIAGDTSGLEGALKKSAKGLGGFKSVALGTFAGNLLGKGLGLAIDGLKSVASFALEGVDAFDELGDSMAVLDGLAKGLGDTVDKQDLSKFGVDRNEAAKGATSIAKMGKSLGLTDKQLGKVTPSLTEMAAQLASLGDGDPVKQADLLAKALAGNAKAAKALGIQLPKGADGMDAYLSIVKQLEPRLDKATDGNASLADVGDRWDATLANLQIELGGMLDKLAPVISQLLDVLLPVFHELVDTVGPMVEELFGNIASAMSGFVESGGAAGVADAFGTIVDILGEMVAFWLENVAPMLAEIGGAILEAIGPLLPKIQELWDKLRPVLELFAGFLKDVVVPILVNLVIPAIGKLLGIVLDLASALLDQLAKNMKRMGDDFQKLVDWIKPVVDWFGRMLDAVGDVIDALGNIKVPDIKLPFGIGGGGGSSRSSAGGFAAGVTVNITTGVGDPVAIGRSVRRYLDVYGARGG